MLQYWSVISHKVKTMLLALSFVFCMHECARIPLCVWVCVCTSVINKPFSTGGNGSDPLKTHCEPLGYQQPSLHIKSEFLDLTV